MAWEKDPKVRELAEYCKNHNYKEAIVIGINEDGKTFETVSYGKNEKLCEHALDIARRFHIISRHWWIPC